MTIGSNNVMSPAQRQAIIWSNAGILIVTMNGFNDILIKMHQFTFVKIHLKMQSGDGFHFVSV